MWSHDFTLRWHWWKDHEGEKFHGQIENSKTMVSIHGHDQHIAAIHQGRKNRKLATSSPCLVRDVTIPSCIWSQPICQVYLSLSSDDGKTSASASRHIQLLCSWIACYTQKGQIMGWPVLRSCYWTGTYEKYEDNRRPDKGPGNDRGTACIMVAVERDDDDVTELLGFLQDRNPFGDDPTLRNIASGVTADSAVNVEVGDKILEAMKAKNVMELPKLPSKSKEK